MAKHNERGCRGETIHTEAAAMAMKWANLDYLRRAIVLVACGSSEGVLIAMSATRGSKSIVGGRCFGIIVFGALISISVLTVMVRREPRAFS